MVSIPSPEGSSRPSCAIRDSEVINLAPFDDDFAESVRRSAEAFDRDRPDGIVGSSRAAVALALDSGDVPVAHRPGLELLGDRHAGQGGRSSSTPKAIMSSRSTTAELVGAASDFAEALVVVGIDHNMTDPERVRGPARRDPTPLRQAVDTGSEADQDSPQEKRPDMSRPPLRGGRHPRIAFRLAASPG